jgi:Tfp pilus assembly protein PilO
MILSVNYPGGKRSSLIQQGFFIVLLLLDRLVLGPILARIKALDEDVQQEISNIRDGLVIMGYKDKINKEYSALKTYLTDAKKSDEEELASFLKDMENIAVSSGIHLVTINPSGNIENAKLYTKYEIKLECLGNMEKLMKFIYAISSLSKLIKIESIELLPPAKGGEDMKCTMLITREIVTL